MKKNKKVFRYILMIFGCCFMSITSTNAQLGASNDVMSQASYTTINSNNAEMTRKMFQNTIAIGAIANVITNEYLDLSLINPTLLAKRRKIRDFIRKESLDFIKVKYPRLETAPRTQEVFKNTFIQTRFQLKLTREARKTYGYLDYKNKMSEGERVLFVISSLEKVINICLENEEY